MKSFEEFIRRKSRCSQARKALVIFPRQMSNNQLFPLTDKRPRPHVNIKLHHVDNNNNSRTRQSAQHCHSRARLLSRPSHRQLNQYRAVCDTLDSVVATTRLVHTLILLIGTNGPTNIWHFRTKLLYLVRRRLLKWG